MKTKLLSLFCVHNGPLYREWRGETENGNFVVVRDVATEIQLGIDEREFNAIWKGSTMFVKEAPGFISINSILDYLSFIPPDDFIDFI